MDTTWEDEVYTRKSWNEMNDPTAQKDFIVASSKLHVEQMRILEGTWLNSDHSAVYRRRMLMLD